MKLAALAAAAALLIAAAAPSAGHAAPDACSTAYNALQADLRRAERPHQEWIAFLTANPSYAPPNDVGSIAIQREIVGLYEWRIWSAYYVAANIDEGLAGALVANFEDHRERHRVLATVPTYSGAAFHAATAANYEWRIAQVITLRDRC